MGEGREVMALAGSLLLLQSSCDVLLLPQRKRFVERGREERSFHAIKKIYCSCSRDYTGGVRVAN